MKRRAALVCVVLTALPIGSASSKGRADEASVGAARPAATETRLVERSRVAAPKILAPASYVVDERELLTHTSYVDPFVKSAVQELPASFNAGRSYRLRFTAHVADSGQASVAVRFREPKQGTFRTYRTTVIGTPSRQYELEFTAPAYTARAELAFEVTGPALAIEQISLRMQSPIANTMPVASWAGSFVPDGYGLIFNDEFNGSELDRHKWFTRFIYASETLDHLNHENQRYTDDGVHRVSGGVLYLTARRLKLSQPSGANYESAMIRSDFTLRYGFVEARVKMPGGLGVWPAFWLNSDVSETGQLSWPPEIDIFEFVNNGKDDKLDKIHTSTTDTPGMRTEFRYMHPHFKQRFRDYFAPFNFNEGWHTVGAEWTANEVTTYVDGLKVVTSTFQWKYADGTLAAPAHILLNLAIGDQWAGRYGIDDSAFPQALAVDWVRAYQKLPDSSAH